MSGNKSWTNPVGIWEVKTEADCEGRNMKTLGIFQGHYCDIAFGLANKCCYSLYFRRIDPSEMIAPTIHTRDTVQITFSDAPWKDANELTNEVRKVANPLNISVSDGMWNNHVKLSRFETEEEKKQKAIQKAKASLTPEELDILGIK